MDAASHQLHQLHEYMRPRKHNAPLAKRLVLSSQVDLYLIPCMSLPLALARTCPAGKAYGSPELVPAW